MTPPERITDNIYRIKVPLPMDLLPYINSYILRGKNRNLIIDTSMNTPLCKEAMQQSLEDLQIDLNRTDFFITHFHKDHMQLAAELATENSIIFMGRIDYEEMEALKENNWFLPDIAEFSSMSAFPEEDLRKVYRFFEKHDEKTSQNSPPITLVEDGDLLEVGDLKLRCIMTPGHSKGHMCLYDPAEKLLFAGDHLLDGITPSIQGRFNDKNPLKDYFDSLEKIDALDVMHVLPGHKRPFTHFNTRISELRDHHIQRTEQILDILLNGETSAYRIASRMSWNVRADSWEDYAPLQRFMAVGETISHLNYLRVQGEIRQERVNGQVVYTLQ
jgi:glyoxylase-like metal-dependent hydrolase (beta-lactamase superfamily II)